MPDQFTLLLEWRRTEASVRSLSKLPLDLYPTTAAYLGELRRSYEADLRENPSGRKGELARQTYQRASQVARDILESRAQKLLSTAFQASIGGPRELPNAVPEERVVFDRILADLLEHRRAVAPFLDAGGPAKPEAGAAPAPPPPPAPAPDPTPPAARGSRGAPAAPTALGGPMAYVRILKDSPAIAVGPDTIDLRADDLLALPPETAKLLVEAKVAEPIATTALTPAT
jgi:DNA replication initiation complex subunit (GINS family)